MCACSKCQQSLDLRDLGHAPETLLFRVIDGAQTQLSISDHFPNVFLWDELLHVPVDNEITHRELICLRLLLNEVMIGQRLDIGAFLRI